MGRYIARRFLKAILLLLVISVFVFAIQVLTDDPARQLAIGPPPEEVEAMHEETIGPTPEEVEAICEEYELEKPVLTERFNSIKGLLLSGGIGWSMK